jgi:maltose/moltooligosaccharide transporter
LHSWLQCAAMSTMRRRSRAHSLHSQSRAAGTQNKPQLSFWQIWNMCFGFLGIQFGFALQNANVSRIFQTLGASMDDIPDAVDRRAADRADRAADRGLPVGPHLDRAGRRRPYFLVGAVLATLALFAMPNSPTLWIARACCGCSTPRSTSRWSRSAPSSATSCRSAARQRLRDAELLHRRRLGGREPAAVAAGKVRRGQHRRPGRVPDTVRYAFYFGGVVLLLARSAGRCCARANTRRKPAGMGRGAAAGAARAAPGAPPQRVAGWSSALAGAAAIASSRSTGSCTCSPAASRLRRGVLLRSLSAREAPSRTSWRPARHARAMRKLAVVQFFSWFALFAMWIYTTGAVTSVHFGSSDTTRAAYNEGANWVGVLFAAYNGFAALAAVVIPWMVQRWGLRISHLINATLGGLGLLSFVVIRDPHGCCCRWSASASPGPRSCRCPMRCCPTACRREDGRVHGHLQFLHRDPAAGRGEPARRAAQDFFGAQPIYALVIGGISLIVAGLCVLRVREPARPRLAASGGEGCRAHRRTCTRCAPRPLARTAARCRPAAAPANAPQARAPEYIGTTEPSPRTRSTSC